MQPTSVKICFRYKNGSRGAVKVFTTVRVTGRRTPLQIHLGYVPSGPLVSETNLARLEKKLQAEWRGWFGTAFVVIDRENAADKWTTRGERRIPLVDRASAQKQLQQWLIDPGAPALGCFGGEHCVEDEFHEQYETFYYRSHEYILRGRTDLDAAHVASWWTEKEMPRLLHRYYHYVRRKPNYHFSRGGFVRYAAFNIGKGYALREYLRARGPQIEVQFGGVTTDPWSGNSRINSGVIDW